MPVTGPNQVEDTRSVCCSEPTMVPGMPMKERNSTPQIYEKYSQPLSSKDSQG